VNEEPENSARARRFHLRDIRSLPTLTAVTIGARCALRVLPSATDPRDFPEEVRESDLCGIEAACLAAALSIVGASVGRPNEATHVATMVAHDAVRAAGAVASQAMVPAAKAAATSARSVASAAARFLDGPATGLRQASTAAAMAAVEAAGPAVEEATRVDVKWLNNPAYRQDVHALLKSPLWHELPVGWNSIIQRWEASLAGHPELVAMASRHRQMLEGTFAWDEAPGIVEAWYERYQTGAMRRDRVESLAPQSPATDSTEIQEAGRDGSPSALHDSPAAADQLGRERLVMAMAETFADPEQGTPITVGLFGDWGAGKSSAMDQLRRRLQADKWGRFDIAWFNAWEYENTDNLAAGLAQETVKGLKAPGWIERGETRLAFAIREHGWEFAKTISYTVAALLPAGVLAWPLIAGASVAPGIATAAQLGGAGVVLGATIYVLQHVKRALEHPLATQLQTYLKLPNYGEHLGLTPVLKRHIRTLCRIRLLNWRRLVVFVDDLDRCKPDSIVTVFEAIRLVMDIPNVIVMIAIDPRIALQAVARHFARVGGDQRAPEDIARDYLGKIIQIPLRLARPGPAEVQNYIQGRLFADLQDAPIDRTSPEWLRRLKEAEAGPQDLEERIKAGDWAVLDEPPPSVDGRQGLEETQGQQMPTQATSGMTEGPMRETLAECVHFTKLSNDLEFNNPRQLLRLRNTYRLAKSLYPEESDWERLMEMLFWQEFVHQWPLDVHRDCEDALRGTKVLSHAQTDLSKDQADQIQAGTKAMQGVFQARYGEDWSAYEQVAHKVKRLVLPRAEGSTKAPEPAEEI